MSSLSNDYNSPLIHIMVNHLTKNGKKAKAYKIIYQTMKNIQTTTKENPIKVFEKAIRCITPLVEVKAKRVGGTVYQVPVEVSPKRGTILAIRWLLLATNQRSGQDFATKLTYEIIEASKNSGFAIRKRDETHRMAEANKAFAY